MQNDLNKQTNPRSVLYAEDFTDKEILLAHTQKICECAVEVYEHTFDKENGGFGNAPKFPSLQNLLFLMNYYEKTKDEKLMEMVNTSLLQMYRGGLFDHIGGGFYHYAKDASFLLPHFQKKLSDNALFIMVYSRAYEITKNILYLGVVEKTARYVMQEMISPRGGFYTAQAADEAGGNAYLFEPKEIYRILGHKDGAAFCRYFDITESGNFQGKNIPNLLRNTHITANYNPFIPSVYEYRKKRGGISLEKQIQMAANALMIGAMCWLYRVTGKEIYLGTAERAQSFLETKVCQNEKLFASWQDGECGKAGELEDYANEIFALLCLYEVTLDKNYLQKAQNLSQKVKTDMDILASEHSMMAYNAVRFAILTQKMHPCEKQPVQEEQLLCWLQEAEAAPDKYALFLSALLDWAEISGR